MNSHIFASPELPPAPFILPEPPGALCSQGDRRCACSWQMVSVQQPSKSHQKETCLLRKKPSTEFHPEHTHVQKGARCTETHLVPQLHPITMSEAPCWRIHFYAQPMPLTSCIIHANHIMHVSELSRPKGVVTGIEYVSKQVYLRQCLMSFYTSKITFWDLTRWL